MAERTRVKVDHNARIRVRTYDLLCQAVEDGVQRGYHLAHKHTASPGEMTLRDAIERGVIEAVLEIFHFPPDPES